MAERLKTTYDRRPSRDICNCTMCPNLGNSRHYINADACDVVDGRVQDPKWSWCMVGIALMWMKSHSQEDGMEFASELDPQMQFKILENTMEELAPNVVVTLLGSCELSALPEEK